MEELKEGWRRVKLEKLGEIVSGGTPKTSMEEYWNGKIAWLTPKDFSNQKNKYWKKGERSITDEGLKNSSAKLMPKGTVLFTSRAPIGYVGIADTEVSTNQGFKNIIANKENSNEFIYYLLKYITPNIESIAGGSTFKEISASAFKNIEVVVPDLEIQEKIASILSSLDDKIEINNEMNKTLEEMAQTLFKRWFIDFDFPNENGEPYRSSGGKMVDSELGEIPEGWEIFKLESLVEKLSKGTTPTKKDIENAISIEKVPFIKVKDLKDDGEIIINSLEYISRDISENKLKRSIIKTNDILFTIAGTIGKVSIIPPTLSNGNLNQAIAFIRLKNLKYREYIYYYLKSKETQNMIYSKIVQAVQANVSLSVLNNLRVLNPTYEILDSYNLLVKKTFDLYLKNQQEKQSLTEIRDTLLPKLMSGEIEV